MFTQEIQTWSFSRVLLSMTHWTVTRQAPLSMGSPQAKILEWVDIPFPRGSSQSRDGDGIHISCVSCIAGRFSTHWATKGPEDPLGTNGVSTLIGTKKAFRSYDDYEPQWPEVPLRSLPTCFSYGDNLVTRYKAKHALWLFSDTKSISISNLVGCAYIWSMDLQGREEGRLRKQMDWRTLHLFGSQVSQQ